MSRQSQLRHGVRRSVLVFVIMRCCAVCTPLTITGLAVAQLCFSEADPQPCCTYAGVKQCTDGQQSWLCSDMTNGPLDAPALTITSVGKHNYVPGPDNPCIRQPRRCGASVGQCENDGAPIITNCDGYVPAGTDCGGGGGGDN